MITVRMTRQEQAALTWDDLRHRGVPVPATVAAGRLWMTCEAAARDWEAIARYAAGQAEHWEDDIGVTSDEASLLRRDAARCRRVADRIRAALRGDA